MYLAMIKSILMKVGTDVLYDLLQIVIDMLAKNKNTTVGKQSVDEVKEIINRNQVK